ncbi:hypothetical protein [Phenylobacterium sp.]|jgi:hypothetical protein|uniref:hypothetical protein n=1 Tax=Phenylobacterium sp. TaxID=1871053 RepID=UPI0037837DA8
MSKKKKSLPKRIGGVKVPKAVRKGGMAKVLKSKAGQALIAEAVMAVAAVATAKKASDNPKVRRFTHEAAEAVRDKSGKGKAEVGAAGGVLAFALGEAVRSFSDALRNGEPRGGHIDADWSPADAGAGGRTGPGAAAQKKTTPRSSPPSEAGQI